MGSTILAIESSCDETSASIIQGGKVLNNVVATQSVHELYGGVVPELASRAHQKVIVPIVRHAIEESGVSLNDLDAIAYTKGPGLLGSLLVGASFAKALAMSLSIPLIGVHHMKAHILSHFIDDPKPQFPFLCLTVSGGHTQLVIVKSPEEMQVIGQTVDDAIGEAFDKCAKILGFTYPGGPLIDKQAKDGNEKAYYFSKTDMPDLDFSFSGIKTSFLYFIRDQVKKDPSFVKNNISDLCASIQRHLIDMVMQKLISAAELHSITEVGIAGGVAANSRLRQELEKAKEERGWNVYIPDFNYCTDNAGMIAMAAHFQFEKGNFESIESVPDARMNFYEKRPE